MRKLSALLVFSAFVVVPLTVATAQSGTTRTSATAPTPPPAANVRPTDDPDQRVRCRNIEITGSLVRRERVCRTVAEWRRLAERGNDSARATQESVGQICAGTCGGGR